MSKQHEQASAISRRGASDGSANTSKTPEDIAKEWLDTQWAVCGPKRLWTQGQWDKYHTELGQLICFAMDCLPNGALTRAGKNQKP